MEIVVISDTKNTVRYQYIKSEMERVGVRFTFFDAVMANRMTPVEIVSKVLPNTFFYNR